MRGIRQALGMALAIVVVGTLGSAQPMKEAGADGRLGLVVHEWGTFSSFSGADGTLLRFNPANTDLPNFVYRRGLNRKSLLAGLVSLETPVVYFYSDRPVTASVRVEFRTGELTDWYPRADESTPPNVLSWPGIRVRPEDQVHLPVSAGVNHYYAAREVDAAPLEIAYTRHGTVRREHESFLFYRGVGDLTPPLALTAQGGSSFCFCATGNQPIAEVLLLEVRAGSVRFRRVGPVAARASAKATLPDTWSTSGALRCDVIAMLVRSGLYEKEASAMVKTWEGTWFGDEGIRVLYVLPGDWTQAALPLKVAPRPDTLVRVLVGRHDMLTPEREREIDQLARRLKGPSVEERRAAWAMLTKLGRFADPALTQAQTRLGSRP